MTYKTKLYRRLHDLNAWYNERTHSLRMWIGYAQALQKNRAHTALWLGPRIFGGIMVFFTLIALLS